MIRIWNSLCLRELCRQKYSMIWSPLFPSSYLMPMKEEILMKYFTQFPNNTEYSLCAKHWGFKKKSPGYFCLGITELQQSLDIKYSGCWKNQRHLRESFTGDMKSRSLRISTNLPSGSWRRCCGGFKGQYNLHTGEKFHMVSKHSRETGGEGGWRVPEVLFWKAFWVRLRDLNFTHIKKGKERWKMSGLWREINYTSTKTFFQNSERETIVF